ncbi:endolytic transglycosylase MltG, partial [bacterium]|nr:endolytic transglycosylase MltG [bacterium]
MLLKEAGVIRSSLLFRFWVACYAVNDKLKPGKYRFNGTESFEKIFFIIMKGQKELLRVTIPEGWRIAQIAHRLEEMGVCSAASFSMEISSKLLLSRIFSDWGEIESPEGLAFPETYLFSKGVEASKVAEVMLSMTHETVNGIIGSKKINGLD